jgi:hypothetical protein
MERIEKMPLVGRRAVNADDTLPPLIRDAVVKIADHKLAACRGTPETASQDYGVVARRAVEHRTVRAFDQRCRIFGAADVAGMRFDLRIMPFETNRYNCSIGDCDPETLKIAIPGINDTRELPNMRAIVTGARSRFIPPLLCISRMTASVACSAGFGIRLPSSTS